MTFSEALIASGYYYQPECGAFCKEDSHGNLHSYVEQEDGEWSYEKYSFNCQSSCDELIVSKSFTLN